MKSFNDLEFKPHPNKREGLETLATLDIGNGYIVSVVTGSLTYGEYEAALICGGEMEGEPEGFDTPDEVTDFIQDSCIKANMMGV